MTSRGPNTGAAEPEEDTVNKPRLTRAISALLSLVFLAATTPSAAYATGHKEVDETRLVPALSPTFAPWDCKAKLTGPVCTGERHLRHDWAPVDDVSCDVPIWGSRVEDRYQIRYYDHDYLNYYSELRTNDVDYFYVCSEALANAVKHARATRVVIEVGRQDSATVASVADDGCGGADPSGSGLQGLADRLAAENGWLRVDSPPGAGTTVTATISR